MKRSIIVRVTFFCIAACILAQPVRGNTDGPYVFYRGDSLDVLTLINGTVHKKTHRKGSPVTVTVPGNDTIPAFNVHLRHAHPVSEALAEETPENFLVLSDFHGRFAGFIALLKHAGVIDDSLNWIFGAGYVIQLGDMLSRGDRQTEVLWLTYKLQGEAAQAGGRFYTLLANHEIMHLTGDLRYVHERYITIARILGKTYDDLFTAQTLFGQWIRSFNTMIKIGQYTFVHGGYGPHMRNANLTITAINTIMRDYLAGINHPNTALVRGSYGPTWYRGYFQDYNSGSTSYRQLTQSEVDAIAAYLQIRRIFVGHTRFDNLQFKYQGKVIGVDVEHGSRGIEGFLYKNGAGYRIRTDGLIHTLFTEPTVIVDTYIPYMPLFITVSPTPLNPVTAIRFSLPSAGNIQLTVHNAKGTVVGELINGFLNSGDHQAYFDGTGLTSGCYFYTLTHQKKNVTGKMILVQ